MNSAIIIINMFLFIHETQRIEPVFIIKSRVYYTCLFTNINDYSAASGGESSLKMSQSSVFLLMVGGQIESAEVCENIMCIVM